MKALWRKDLRREWASKESLLAGLVMVGLFFVLFLFVGATTDRFATLALWTPLVYATAAMTGRGLAAESDRGTLEWLLSMPGPAAAIGWSRTAVDLMVAAILSAITLALVSWTFAVDVTLELVAIIAAAALGLTVVGAMIGGIAAQARLREVLVPVLLIPVASPLMQAGVTATMDALAGQETWIALRLMIGYDLIVVGLAWLLWPHILGAD